MGRLRVGTVGFFVAVAALALAGVVFASHIAGGIYTGTITGGGTVRFTVSGNRVDNFVADADGTGATCTPRTVTNMVIGTAANHPFSGSTGSSGVSPTLFSVAGTFPTAGTARGTLSIAGQGAACNRATNTAWSATSQVAATPIQTPTPGRALPKSGAPSVAIALSGLSLLEAGWGLRLLSRRFDTPLHMVPAFLLRKLLRARRHGRDEVKLTEEWYLVWRKDEDR